MNSRIKREEKLGEARSALYAAEQKSRSAQSSCLSWCRALVSAKDSIPTAMWEAFFAAAAEAKARYERAARLRLALDAANGSKKRGRT